jgi:hypothetical protein
MAGRLADSRTSPPAGSSWTWPVVAFVIAAVIAVTVVSAALVLYPWNGVSGPPGCGDCGVPWALSPPRETNSSGQWWYNFTSQSAMAGMVLNNVQVQIQTTGAGVVTPASSWTLTALGANGSAVGAYSMTTAVWTSGGEAAVTSGMIIALHSGTTRLSGDNFVVFGVGAFQGTISVAIP